MSMLITMIIAVAILFLSPYMYGTSSFGQSGQDGISIVSLLVHEDEKYKSTYVSGEIRNNLAHPVKNVRINLTFFGADAIPILAGSVAPFLDTLRPGEKSAFDFPVPSNTLLAQGVKKFSFYRASTSWETSEQKPAFLKMGIDSIKYDSECGNYQMAGKVSNNGNSPATDIVISAGFYNELNQILTTTAVPIDRNENTIEPANSEPFLITLRGPDAIKTDILSLNVQSREYSKVQDDDDGDGHNEHFLDMHLDRESYASGETMTLTGRVASESDVERYIVFEILTPGSDSPFFRFTSPVSNTDGSFSRSVSLEGKVQQSFEGHVLKLRASYQGSMAERLFVYGISQEGLYSIVNQPCDQAAGEQEWWRSAIISQSPIAVYSPEDGSRPLFEAGLPIILETTLQNDADKGQMFTAVIMAVSEDGITEFINVENGTIGPTKSQESAILWTPDAEGDYMIRSFVINESGQAKDASSPSTLLVRISKSEPVRLPGSPFDYLISPQ